MLPVHGYHPLAEDGGLYVAGIQYLLNPTLFPHSAAFVTAHLHYSLFAPAIVALVHITHLPLAGVLLTMYISSLWLTLFAGLQVLRRCIAVPAAQLAGVALLAAWATLPIAGTSLMLLDPYLTARSLTTPLTLFAIAFALDPKPLKERRPFFILLPPLSSLLCLLIAAPIHPLMAGCALTMVIAVRLLRQPKALPLSLFASTLIVIAAAVHLLAPPESPASVAAALSRYYWFLSQWQWYELCGLLGPFCIFALLLRWAPRGLAASARTLCLACLFTGGIAILTALLFAHRNAPTHLLARLQPLRIFLPIYAIMALLLGASLMMGLRNWLSQWHGTAVRRFAFFVPVMALLLNAVIFFQVQRETYPASRHIELPRLAPINAWSRAFLWSRDNTPPDALFALDADYITTPGEDAQSFRATALRSALPDFSKDGGEASITPVLSGLWQSGVTAQTGLSRLLDPQRDARLLPLGVTWMVLHSDAGTLHPCPYDNGTVKVCDMHEAAPPRANLVKDRAGSSVGRASPF